MSAENSRKGKVALLEGTLYTAPVSHFSWSVTCLMVPSSSLALSEHIKWRWGKLTVSSTDLQLPCFSFELTERENAESKSIVHSQHLSSWASPSSLLPGLAYHFLIRTCFHVYEKMIGLGQMNPTLAHTTHWCFALVMVGGVCTARTCCLHTCDMMHVLRVRGLAENFLSVSFKLGVSFRWWLTLYFWIWLPYLMCPKYLFY